MIQLVFVSLLKISSKIYQQVAHQFGNFFKERIFQKFSFRKKIFSEARKCAYQEVRNVGFSENFAYVLNG